MPFTSPERLLCVQLFAWTCCERLLRNSLKGKSFNGPKQRKSFLRESFDDFCVRLGFAFVIYGREHLRGPLWVCSRAKIFRGTVKRSAEGINNEEYASDTQLITPREEQKEFPRDPPVSKGVEMEISDPFRT